MKHIGVYCTNNINKNQLIQAIRGNKLFPNFCNLIGLKGEVYSSITIDAYIEEEYKHGSVVISSEANPTLEEMSSGQQRMALANYIFKQMPDYVILDDIQDNVDAQTLSHLHQLLAKHGLECLYIQILSRIDDALPYLSQVIEIDNFMGITGIFSQQEFLSGHANEIEPTHLKLPQLFSEIPYFNPLVTMQNVMVAYDLKPILNKIDWTIKAGEFWELRGPVGSGKSTLLSMIIGDNPKAFGQDIYLFGRKKGSGESVWDIKRNIGYFYPKMMQLFSRETSIENMIVSGFYDSIGLYVKPTDSHQKIAKEWVEILGQDYKNKKFQSLSPGQQRIVLVIRAIVKQPPLLILDEPTVGLDEYNIQLFLSMVKAIAQTKKVAIIFVSHRKETGLQADYIYELQPTENGSVFKITKNERIIE
jgi:molybdate transport system ATP-binding protein